MSDRNTLTEEDYLILRHLHGYPPPFTLEPVYRLHPCRERWLSAIIRKLLFRNLLLIEGLADQATLLQHSLLVQYTYRISDEGRKVLAVNNPDL